MPDIVLDARMIHHSGIGTYLRGLLEGYRDQPFFHEHELTLAVRPSSGINGKSGQLLFRSPIYSIREQVEYPFRMKACRLWHAPHYNIPLIKMGSRLVVTIHDLIHWIFKSEFYSSAQAAYARLFFTRLAKCADKIIAVSEKTREDLMHYFQIPRERIRVIYEGVSENFFHVSDPARRRQFLSRQELPDQFFLYVGLMKPHKNVNRLIRIYRKLRSEGKLGTPLVMVGKKDKKYPKGQELTQNLATGDGIFYLPQIASQEELAFLYGSAKALVHPSLYEGFGLTCLEAMASGLPVAVSRVASLPEVTGDAGFYFDPYSDDSLSEALTQMDSNDGLRKALSQKGKDRARRFSWNRAAEETIQVYKEVLEG